MIGLALPLQGALGHPTPEVAVDFPMLLVKHCHPNLLTLGNHPNNLVGDPLRHPAIDHAELLGGQLVGCLMDYLANILTCHFAWYLAGHLVRFPVVHFAIHCEHDLAEQAKFPNLAKMGLAIFPNGEFVQRVGKNLMMAPTADHGWYPLC